MAERRPSSFDYDSNIERWRTGRSIVRDYGTNGTQDIHGDVAAHLVDLGAHRVLDVGCGDGELARFLPPEVRWTGIDLSVVQVENAPRPVVRGHASRLPFRDDSFDAAAALWMLYHLDDPRAALVEIRRVLAPGGVLAVSAPSQHDSPELAPLFPPQPPSTFDAELAPQLMEELFAEVDVDAWDGPYWTLPDAEAVARALVGGGVPPARAAEMAASVKTPLVVTKRGAIVYGRKPR